MFPRLATGDGVNLFPPYPHLTVYLQEEVKKDGSTGVEAEVLDGGERACAAKHEGDEIRQRSVWATSEIR